MAAAVEHPEWNTFFRGVVEYTYYYYDTLVRRRARGVYV